jgi:glycine oxidase
METWDAIIIGAGVIGLSLARELTKRGLRVLIIERGEPGRESSYAAAGMLADSEVLPPVRRLAALSAKMYPEFVHELRDESGVDCDLRELGTILLRASDGDSHRIYGIGLSSEKLLEIEPELSSYSGTPTFLRESSVDPRGLISALLQAARRRGIDLRSGTAVVEMMIDLGRVAGVRTDKSAYTAPIVVNCAGAWAGLLARQAIPIRPVKGQVLCLVGGPRLQHVVRAPDVYLVPRSDGRILIGATVEEAGFDKRTDADVIRRLHEAAIKLVPSLASARIHDAWAGLRPAAPDGLPVLGKSWTPGCYFATGHFRDGILLTPATARVMAELLMGETPACDLAGFSPLRFRN